VVGTPPITAIKRQMAAHPRWTDRRAGILDEVFVTVTGVHIEPSGHEGIKRIFAFEAGAACLIAEGRTAQDVGYVFRRWRFNER
jgi:hypothetical protein